MKYVCVRERGIKYFAIMNFNYVSHTGCFMLPLLLLLLFMLYCVYNIDFFYFVLSQRRLHVFNAAEAATTPSS
jgi:hypothetical protein